MSELLILERLAKIEKLILDQTIVRKEILSFNEAGNYLELSHSALYKLTSKKEIPHFCPNGKKLYFRRDELDTWLQRNRQQTVYEVEKLAENYIKEKQRK